MLDPQSRYDELTPLLDTQAIENTTVYPVIHTIRRDIMLYVDNPLSFEALLTPDLTYTLVKPLEDKYARFQREGNLSIVFCLLLNRVHFTRDQSFSTMALSKTRADLCEILAIRATRFHADDMLEVTTVLTTSWPLFAGASAEVIKRAEQEEDMDVDDSVGNALEMAILGKAKRFIKSSPCQNVIDGIWSGKCVYQADSSHSILSDTYKRTPVHLYNPHTAPLLDHYRLKVPAVRSVLEYINFIMLFILFVIALEWGDAHHVNFPEVMFMVYALGFSLEKLASIQEHGIRVYVTGTWNGFDVIFISVYLAYLGLRLYGVLQHDDWALTAGMDCLALAACLIFPRLAFVTLSNNLMILSLRSMFVEFTILMTIATFCFAGFLYALWTLSRNGPVYTGSQIAWWMLNIFFGLDATGFDRAPSFHPIFGPVLMISYACLSNTLLLTVLVSILSHTFSTINADAAAEAMYRRAVSTVEGVKADALFSYQPPLNLFALFIMLPASYILTPRWFHKVNVFMIRLTSFPILLCISLYERHKAESGAVTFYEHVSLAIERVLDWLPKSLKRISFFEGFSGGGGDIDAVFDIEDEIMNDEESTLLHKQTTSPRKVRRSSASGMARPRRSSFFPASSSTDNGHGYPRNRALGHRLSGVAEDTPSAVRSPLAQAYVPFEESLHESALAISPSQSTGTLSANYSPTIRRRRSSVPHQTAASQRNVSGPSSDEATPAEPRPKSVTQLTSETELLGGDATIEKRLARIEKMQTRLENMLAQLGTG